MLYFPFMESTARKQSLFQGIYWLASSIVLGFVYRSFTDSFAQAWMLSMLMMPGALFARLITQVLKSRSIRKSWHYWIYTVIGTMWLVYMGAIAAYWYLFQLDPDQFPTILINPSYTGLWIAALILGEHQLARQLGYSDDSTQDDLERQITFTSDRKTVLVNEKELLYVESLDRITRIHGTTGKFWDTSRPISQWESETGWLRIHRSFLVNATHVQGFNSKEVTLKYPLEQPTTLSISRSYKDSITQRLSDKIQA
ncbi:MAG: hypothetical protein RL754_1118 [Bacteroidota bacterium]|jgi:hypothetical protein